MSLRTFVDRDGQHWRVWSVVPSRGNRAVRTAFLGGRVCFERAEGGERCRLSTAEVPEGWAELADERLDLLRRVASATNAADQDVYWQATVAGWQHRTFATLTPDT